VPPLGLDVAATMRAAPPSGGKVCAVDDGNSRLGEVGVHLGHRSVEVDGAAGIAEDDGVEAESASVEGRVADAEVIGKPDEEDARQIPLLQVASEAGGRPAIILKERRVGIDGRPEPLAQNHLGLRKM